MTLTKLGSVAIRVAHKNVLLQRLPVGQMKPLRRFLNHKPMDESLDDQLDKPIKFSSSEAASWNAEYSRTGGPPDEFPWYSPYVVMASVSIFLIYFCVIREENDIDQKLTMSLSDHFQGEQKRNLEATMELPDKVTKGQLRKQ